MAGNTCIIRLDRQGPHPFDIANYIGLCDAYSALYVKFESLPVELFVISIMSILVSISTLGFICKSCPSCRPGVYRISPGMRVLSLSGVSSIE